MPPEGEGKPEAGSTAGGEPEPVLPKNSDSMWQTAKNIAHNPAEGMFGQKNAKGVFNKLKTVITGKNAYETEKAEADLKQLSSGDIAQAQALALSEPGTVQTIIRGDHIDVYQGNHFVEVDKGDYLTVKQIQKHEVDGNAQLRFLSNRDLVVRGNYQLSVFKRSDTYVLGPSTEQYVGVHELTVPEEFEWKQLERGFSALKLDTAVFGLDMHASAVDMHVIDVELAVFEGVSKVFREKTEAQEMHAILIIIRFALELDIMIRGDILIDLGTGTPFR